MLALATLGADRAVAQASATFDVAVYIPQPVVVLGDRDLQFGRVIPNTTVTVAHDDATGRSAQFTLTGAACAEADVHFTLPATLSGPGAASMPISAWTGSYAGGSSATFAAFTPSASSVRMLFDRTTTACTTSAGTRTDDENGRVVVRVGASVQPEDGQAAGDYSGTLAINVTYIGW